MGEELQGEVCGGKWAWNSSRSLFGSSPSCSLAGNSFEWADHDLFVEEKARSTEDSAGSGSDGTSSSVLLQNVPRPPNHWNQDLLPDGNYSGILREATGLISGMDYQQSQINASETCTAPGLSAAGFPLNPSSYRYASSFLQTLFDTDIDQPEQSNNLLDSNAMDYSSNINSDEFLSTLPAATPMLGKQQQQLAGHVWNTSAAALSGVHGSLIIPHTRPQFVPSSLNINKHNLSSCNPKHQSEASRDNSLVSKKAGNSDQPMVKRPRMETPSPLPTFKVRKEKLGDRITALQQLVSPFGKTDTASVLHEAIEYIKFLHDQVSVLCTPYLKKGSPDQVLQHLKDPDDQEGQIQDLRSGGLCLVPISSTFPVADTTADFWTPTLGSFKL